MNKKHLVFVINPRAGVNRNKQIQHAINSQLDLNRFDYSIEYTQYPHHGTEIAREAVRHGAYAVVAVGGDGSVNDVAKGLIGSDTALAIIPLGSGNGLARTLGIPANSRKAIQTINADQLSLVDIGYANERLFLSCAGVGFEALISDRFKNSSRRGLLTYIWLIIRNFFSYSSKRWEIDIDGRMLHEKGFIVTVANGQQFGYNFHIAPTADLQDGKLDLVVVRKFPVLAGFGVALLSLQGKLLESRYVHHYRGKSIKIASEYLALLQTDGDAYPCNSEVRFSIQPQALKVMAS